MAADDPNTTLLQAATGGYNARVMAIHAVKGRSSKVKRRHIWLRRAGAAVALVIAALLVSILAFRFINPPITPVMVAEKLKGVTLKHQWVPLESISRELPLAVIASEDGRFCDHWGVDWAAVKEAIEEAKKRGRSIRGASTIPMQTAKNLYLWTRRSYVRKGLEVPLAYLLTVFWPKQRVIEVYLNIAQWGPGIFGAEAASLRLFSQERGETDPARGAFACRGAAQSASAQSLKTKRKNAANCAVDRSENADSRLALGLCATAILRREKPAVGPLASAGVSHYKGGHGAANERGTF